MNYFFYSLNTQFANTGDLLINKSLINLLTSKGIVYIEDYNKPEQFVNSILTDDNKIIRLSSISNKNRIVDYLKEKIKQKNKDDNYYLVFVPGDFSRTKFRHALSLLKYFKEPLLLRLQGVKILRLGVSLGTFKKFNGWIESLHSLTYFAYAVRDTRSLELARKYKFSHLSYLPDLAWAYNWENKQESTSLKDYIVISFRSNASGINHNSEYIKGIIDKLQETLKNSSLSSSKILISYQVEYDNYAAKEIYERLFNENFNVELVDKMLNLDEALKLYYNAKCVISNRLHVLLLSILADTLAIPFVSKTDNRKIAGIYDDNELNNQVLYQNEDNFSKLNNIILNIDIWLAKYKIIKEKNYNHILECIDNIIQ